MTSLLLLRARAAWLLGAGLIVSGLLLLLYLAALFARQFGAHPMLGLLPELPPAWMTSLHLAMGLALLGAAVAGLGVFVARRQAARIRTEKSRREDARRRVYEYRDASRLEPYIGWPDEPPVKRTPQMRKMHSLQDAGPC